VYLAAAFPAQMLVSVGTGAPPLTLALLFLTNCADASLGAFLVRRITRSDRPFVFDGLAATMIFVAFGAILPTVLLSFADAGISVATGWSNSYYAAFATRARSNVLTHLIVVPAIVDLVGLDWRRLRAPRVIEGTALAGLLLLIGYQNLVTIPNYQRAGSSQILPMHSLITAGTLGDESLNFSVPADKPFGLFVDVPYDPAFRAYLLALESPSGRTTPLRSLNAAEAQKTQIFVINPGRQAGKYAIVVSGLATAAADAASAKQLAGLQFTVALTR